MASNRQAIGSTPVSLVSRNGSKVAPAENLRGKRDRHDGWVGRGGPRSRAFSPHSRAARRDASPYPQWEQPTRYLTRHYCFARFPLSVPGALPYSASVSETVTHWSDAERHRALVAWTWRTTAFWFIASSFIVYYLKELQISDVGLGWATALPALAMVAQFAGGLWAERTRSRCRHGSSPGRATTGCSS